MRTVIGHLKDDHRMGRNYLAHASGDAIDGVLAAGRDRSPVAPLPATTSAASCTG